MTLSKVIWKLYLLWILNGNTVGSCSRKNFFQGFGTSFRKVIWIESRVPLYLATCQVSSLQLHRFSLESPWRQKFVRIELRRRTNFWPCFFNWRPFGLMIVFSRDGDVKYPVCTKRARRTARLVRHGCPQTRRDEPRYALADAFFCSAFVLSYVNSFRIHV